MVFSRFATCKRPWEDALNTCNYFAPGKDHHIILSRLSSAVVLSLHGCYKFCSSMHGICVSRIKPGQSPQCGIPEKALAVTSGVSQQHPEILDFSQF